MAKILVVEDDRILADLVRQALEKEHHTVEIAFDGSAGRNFIETQGFEILILDWNLPDITGVELCTKYRADGGEQPVLFLTAKSDIQDKAEGFLAGADDYLTKPFDSRELVMRVRALLRRPALSASEILTFESITVEPRAGRVTKDGNAVWLQPRELALLEFFLRHPDTLFSGDALLDRVWDADSDATEVALRSCIAKLRRKLDTPGEKSIIESVHGRGYKLRSL